MPIRGANGSCVSDFNSSCMRAYRSEWRDGKEALSSAVYWGDSGSAQDGHAARD